METVLLHKSAFLYVTSIFRLSSFVFANALLTGITKTFVPFYSSFPEILRNFAIITFTMKKILNEQLDISDTNPLKARYYDYKRFTYPWHFHSEFEIIYVEKGYGQGMIGDSITHFSDQSLFVLGSNLPHYVENPPEYTQQENLRVNGVIIQFEKDFMQYAFSHYSQFQAINRLLKNAQRGLLYSIAAYPDIPNKIKCIPQKEGVEQIVELLRLLDALTRTTPFKFISSPAYEPVPSRLHGRKIEKVIAYLNTHYTQDIRLEDVASYAAMNTTAFCRFFKENTGKTFKQHITDMRIGYACKLLLNEQWNISEICLECGFESVAHFNRCFKQHTEMTPTTYRKKNESFSSIKIPSHNISTYVPAVSAPNDVLPEPLSDTRT